jgi:hypothetical protein
MKLLKYLLITLLIMTGFSFAADKPKADALPEFTFAIARVLIDEDPVQMQVKKIQSDDEGISSFLRFLEKNTTVKVNKTVAIITFKKVEDIEKYPFIFISANGPIRFTALEVKNMAEYCKRGGFIFVDDCVTPDGKGSLFTDSFKVLVQEKIFPGTKPQLLDTDHEIYHCLFDLPKGLPYMQGELSGGYGVFDDKNRMMMFISPHDIHCGWFQEANWFGKKKTEEAFKMGANIVVYAMTH